MLAREWTRQSRETDDPAGAHIPFTAPLLSGVCVRANRAALDFLLPNPSGGRGTYVVGWKSVAEYTAPTLHDVMLAGRLSELAALDPATVRETARAVAVEGYAGRLAADAASRGKQRADADRLRLWSRLLMALVGASTLHETERTLLLQNLGAAGPGVMTVGLNALAWRLGWEPATLFDGLGQLSARHAPLVQNGRAAILLAHFAQLRVDLSRELGRLQIDPLPGGGRPASAGNGAAGAGQPLPSALRRMLPDLDHCLRYGRSVADAAARTLEQPVELLDSWRVDPAIPLGTVERVERALDGWDRIALLWQDCSSPSSRIAVLPEIALLLRLAAERIRCDNPASTDRTVGALPPSEAGTPANDAEDRGKKLPEPIMVPALVERNERVRALELDLEGCNG